MNKKNPPRLKLSGELTLHTQNAQKLFLGQIRKSMGLPAFNKQLLMLQNAVVHDDPFAEWILLRTYDAIVQAHRKLQKMEITYQALLKPTEGIRLHLAEHPHPATLPIRFRTSYTRAVVHLVASYDRIVRSLLAAQESGLKPDKLMQSIQSITDILRDVLTKPNQWQKTETTRQDIRQQTPNGQAAIQHFASLGKLPERVLAGTLQAPKKIEFTPVSTA